jgi:hypothetical protein
LRLVNKAAHPNDTLANAHKNRETHVASNPGDAPLPPIAFAWNTCASSRLHIAESSRGRGAAIHLDPNTLAASSCWCIRASMPCAYRPWPASPSTHACVYALRSSGAGASFPFAFCNSNDRSIAGISIIISSYELKGHCASSSSIFLGRPHPGAGIWWRLCHKQMRRRYTAYTRNDICSNFRVWFHQLFGLAYVNMGHEARCTL